MKNFVGIFSILAFLWAGVGTAAPIVVEVPLQKVFVPKTGYDNNDPIEVVVRGELPNPCYTLGNTELKRIAGTKRLQVRQYAWVTLVGPCGADLFDDPIPFTGVASAGLLPEANYSVIHVSPAGKSEARDFLVEKAKSNEVDNFAYAAIQAVDMRGTTFEEQDVIITLNGITTSKCQELEKPIAVEKQDDVIVVMPKIKTTADNCEKRVAPFSETINIGKLKMGAYLVHVRSRGGKAVYRSFDVWPYVNE